MLTPELIQSIARQRGDTLVGSTANSRASELDAAWNTPDTSSDSNVSEPSLGAFGKAASDFSTGFAKAGLSTLKGVGTIGQKILDTTVNKLPIYKDTPLGSDLYRSGTEAEKKALDILKPEGTAENVGYGTERIAEFFVPASKAARAEEAINILSKGIESPLLASTARIVGKSAVQGASAGAVSLAQTGGDIKEASKVAATAGAVRGGLAIIGEGARALHLPERLYSTVFKNSAKDMLTELKSNGLQALQTNNPEKFDQLVKNGIIKLGNDGNPILNETLAEQALDKGLRGSIRNMANEVVEGALKSEDEVRKIAKTYAGTVDMSEQQYINVLNKISSEYKDVGFGEIASEADDIIKSIKDSSGNVSAETAIKAKRFLDRVRIGSSFDKAVTDLSTSQANLKTLADTIRKRVNAIPGMGSVMKEYSFYIDALEDLAREASRRGNNQILSLIDSLFLSGAYAGNNPVPGVTMGVIRKILQSPTGATILGQMLKNSNLSPIQNSLISVGSSGVQSSQKDQ